MITSHHAFICYSDLDKEDCTELFIDYVNRDDLDYFEIEVFGIREARELINKAYRKPVAGKYKIITVKTTKITTEAEQAMLKILEEPPTSAIFFFIIPPDCFLLPTLRSRFLLYEHQFTNEDNKERFLINQEFTNFAEKKYKERMEIVTINITKKDEKWIFKMKEGLTLSVSKLKYKLKPSVLTKLNMILMTLNTRGASNKMLLEELALVLPEEIKL
ncbi:MAG: hypothetical protein R3B60_04525 [Candidatus Paceibacterota bacterium]